MFQTLLEALHEATNLTISDILEKYPDKIFHWSPYKFDAFNSGAQGAHAAKDISVCRDRATIIKGESPGYLYILQPKKADKKIIANFDPLYWSAKELCKIMLAKINNDFISAVTDYTNPEDPDDHWSDEVSPDKWYMDGLTPDDKDFLMRTMAMKDEKAAFRNVAKFIKSKGYDYIEYTNYGEGKPGDLSYLFFEGQDIQIIERIDLITVSDW